MSNVIQEYLVRLGFDSDEPSLRKFQTFMADAERTVTNHATGMARHILEAQGAISGSFMAISAAIVGVADKAAMADQSYRLMGLRMMMTTEQARSLSMVTKALGVDLAQIYWDPELGARAQVLSMDIKEMSADLGPAFEKNMLGIRNFRMELSRLELGFEFLGMKFASNLFERMDPAMLEKFDRFVTNLENNIPLFANKLADYAVPALEKTWMILGSLADVGESAGLMFTNIVGLLSGDSSIEGAAFSFDKWATAIGHVSDGMIEIFKVISDGEQLLAHFVSALALTLSGKFGDAAAEFKAGIGLLTIGSGAVAGAFAGPPVGAAVGGIGGGVAGFMSGAAEGAEVGSVLGPLGSVAGGLAGGVTGALAMGSAGAAAGGASGGLGGMAIGGFLGWLHEMFGEKPEKVETSGHDWIHGGIGNRWLDKQSDTERPPKPSDHGPISMARPGIPEAITAAADKYHVPRSLALAVAQEESGMHPDAVGQPTSHGRALGLFQLMPETAKTLGVDASDALQNIDGGVRFLAQMLQRYNGDTVKALSAYAAGPARADKAATFADLPDEARHAVPKILRIQQQIEKNDTAAVGSWRSTQGAPDTVAEPAPQRAIERFTAPTPAPERFFSTPTSAPSTDETSSSTPFWYNLAPRWLTESPTWYAMMPSWMSRSGDTTKDVSPAMALLQRPLLPSPNVSHSEQSVTVSLGGIYITQPGADAGQIQRAVANGIRDGLSSQTQWDMTQLQPAW